MTANLYASSKYRITLLVTYEEECAIINLFSLKGWEFVRMPDENASNQEVFEESIEQVTVAAEFIKPSVVKNTVDNFSEASSATLDATENVEQALNNIPEERTASFNNVKERETNLEYSNNVSQDVGFSTNLTHNNYITNSFFQIPSHIANELSGNTEILSRTKNLLLTLTNELKGLSSLKPPTNPLIETEDVDTDRLNTEVNIDANSINKSTANAETPADQVPKNIQRTRAKKTTVTNKVKEILKEPKADNGISANIRKRLRKMARKRSTSPKPLDSGKNDDGDMTDTGDEESSGRIKPSPVKLYEDGDAVRNEVDKHIDEMSLVMIKNDKMVCCMCKKTFENEDSFKKHASFCLTELHNRHGSHTYKCTDCLAYFRQAFTLLRHRQSEVCTPGQKKKIGTFLVCEFCKKSYPSRRRSEYIHHLQTHKNFRPFCCDVCGKDFVRWTTLRDHKRTHTGEKPFQCRFCPQTFVSGPGQRNHEMVRHENLPKTFVCDKCGASFKLRGRLTCHMREVHDTSTIYTCEFCQKTFTRKGSFGVHRRIHLNCRDKICEVCGKAFILQARLSDHMKRHRNERSHFCEECGKGFYTRLNLEDHKRTHSGDKPFSCLICNYHCACYSNTIKHIRTRHPEVTELKKVIANNNQVSKTKKQNNVSEFNSVVLSSGNFQHTSSA